MFQLPKFDVTLTYLNNYVDILHKFSVLIVSEDNQLVKCYSNSQLRSMSV